MLSTQKLARLDVILGSFIYKKKPLARRGNEEEKNEKKPLCKPLN